jgi:hypothetical protein
LSMSAKEKELEIDDDLAKGKHRREKERCHQTASDANR